MIADRTKLTIICDFLINLDFMIFSSYNLPKYLGVKKSLKHKWSGKAGPKYFY